MATIEKKNAGYKITVSCGYSPDGKQIRKRMVWTPTPGMTKRQIEKELNRQATLFEERVKTGGVAVDGKIRFRDFLDLFMKNYVQLYRKPNTIARYERDIARIKQGLGHIRLDDLKAGHISAFAAALQEDGVKQGGGKLAPSSVDTILRTLSSALGKAVRWGYMDSNPCQYADGPGATSEEAAYLDEPDARRMLALLADEPIKWRALITFDLLSGLRRGELLGLQWGDIDFDNHLVHIQRTWNYTSAMGCYMGTPKSARSKRPLHLSTSVFVTLLEYKRWQDDQRKALGDAWKGDPNDNRVFTTDEGAPIFPTSPTWWLSRFTQRTGLPPVSIHSLRHTFASLMIADDVPIVEVASQLGHAKASTTTNIYGHVIASAHAKALTTFDRFNDIVAPLVFPQKEKVSGE